VATTKSAQKTKRATMETRLHVTDVQQIAVASITSAAMAPWSAAKAVMMATS